MKSEWIPVTLNDVVDILGDGIHGTPKYSQNGEYAFINGNNLVDGQIQIKESTKRVNVEEYNKHKKALSDRTILVSINGTLGNLAVYRGEKVILGKSACYFNVSKNVCKDYIRFIVMSPDFQSYLENQATGTTIKNVSLKQMREYSFLLPPLEVQKAIAAILLPLNKKIEMNQRINDNLQQQAQALFKSWFVDFAPFHDRPFIESALGPIPQGWKVYNLSDFLPVITGKKNANVSSTQGKYPFFSCAQDFSWTDEYSFEGHAILVAGNGDFNVKWYHGKFEAYQRTYVLIPKDEKFTSWLYYAVKYNLDNITSAARGSVIKFITKGNLENFSFAAPVNLDGLKILLPRKKLGKRGRVC